MIGAAHFSDLKTIQVFIIHIKFKDVSRKARTLITRIPIPRNLLSIFTIQDRVKNGLLRQTWREQSIPALHYQIKFFLANRPVKCCPANH